MPSRHQEAEHDEASDVDRNDDPIEHAQQHRGRAAHRTLTGFRPCFLTDSADILMRTRLVCDTLRAVMRAPAPVGIAINLCITGSYQQPCRVFSLLCVAAPSPPCSLQLL